MSRYFPDIDYEESARSASKAGAVSAIVFSATICIGIAVTAMGLKIPGEPTQTDPTSYASQFVGMGVELIIIWACAWRF